MSKYGYNLYGWLTGPTTGDRSTSVAPPATSGAPVVGQPWPNWSGVSWVMVNYTTPGTLSQAQVTDPSAWFINVGPFYDRFGDQEIPILASADPIVQAWIRSTQVRMYIDLKNPKVAAGIDLLISKGFTLNKTVIIDTLPTAAERYNPRPF